jgi:hypothetical protein
MASVTALNHTLTGVLIASQAPAGAAPVLAFMSHFLLDVMPHFGNHPTIRPWTQQFKTYLAIDLMLALAALGMGILLFPDKWLLVVVCVGFATVPDALWLLQNNANKLLQKILKFLKDIQWGESPKGWIYEVLFALAAISFIIAL